MRAAWIGPDRAKRNALHLQDLTANKVYRGLAVLTVAEIRHSGADILDSRENYRGHADIKMGVQAPTGGNPLPAPELKVLRDRMKELAKVSRYYADPHPAARRWHGPPLT